MIEDATQHTQEALLLGRVYQFILLHARRRRLATQPIESGGEASSNSQPVLQSETVASPQTNQTTVPEIIK